MKNAKEVAIAVIGKLISPLSQVAIYWFLVRSAATYAAANYGTPVLENMEVTAIVALVLYPALLYSEVAEINRKKIIGK